MFAKDALDVAGTSRNARDGDSSGTFTHGIDTRKLLRKLHNHTNHERCSQSRATYKLCHRDGRLGLLSSFLRSHLLNVFLYLVTGSQPSQSFPSLFLPLFSNEQISEMATVSCSQSKILVDPQVRSSFPG